MRVDVYESSKRSMLFLFVPKGAAPSNVTVPNEIDFGTWTICKSDFDMASWHPNSGPDGAEVARDIEANGFALGQAHF